MSADAINHFETRLKGLTESVHEAQTLVSSGKMVNMNGLDTESEVLLADIQTAPPKVKKALAPALSALISALDHLEAEIRHYKAQKEKEQSGS